MSPHKKSAWSSKAQGKRQCSTRSLALVATLLAMCGGFPLFFGGIAHAQIPNDPKDLLLHVRQNVLDTIERLPRYLCTQVVDRTRYLPPISENATATLRTRSCDDIVAEARGPNRERRLFSTDRLRFDVAVSRSVPGVESEMYSWAGEDHFGDHDLFEFVREGSISTGSFSSLLAAIFGSNVPTFSYSGDSTVGGRLLSEFTFRVAQEESSYTYVFGHSPSEQTTMEYDGTILADPETSDLVQLTIRSDQPPSETGTCELTQTLDYGRVRLHDADFLLPKDVRVSVIHADGSEAENRIQYSACREFRGKSVIRFPSTETEVQASNSSAPVPPLMLPPGLPFKVIFTDPIDTATAAAGDPIRGRLKTAIRDHSSNTLVPEGTSVTGRILSITHYYEPSAPWHPIARTPGLRQAGSRSSLGPSSRDQRAGIPARANHR